MSKPTGKLKFAYESISNLERKVKQLEQELEVERMRLAACGAVAMANTRESAKQAREMQDENKSASLDDVIRAVDSEMALRKERDALKAHCSDLEVELEYHIKPCDCGHPKICEVCRNNKDIEELLCRDLGVSLHEIQASTIETMIDSMDWSKGIAPEDCYEYAKQIREGITQ